MGIAICQRRKFGKVWGSTAPLPNVAGKLRCRKAPLWTFDYHKKKSKLFCDVTLGCRLVTGRFILGVLYGENRPKSENWATLMPRSSATVRCTKKLSSPLKLPGPWTTTRSKQYLSAMHPLTCSLLWVRCLFDPSKFGVWGQMTPEWKLFINFCPKSAFHPRFTCRGQIWRKSAVAKLPKSRLILLTNKPGVAGILFSPPPPHFVPT